MLNVIKPALLESVELRQQLLNNPTFLEQLSEAIQEIMKTVKAGGTIYSCGNGGSACDSIHLTEELVARYKAERPGIRARHLVDPAILSCWANDYEYRDVFVRQIETFCGARDLLVCISTSGKSPNILAAAKAAKAKGTYVLGLSGKDGGELKGLCDLCLCIPSAETARIQELHITLIHIICECLEPGKA
jgi:D-sedoheptulose 7-phosphate isomerase